jgi:hypothetical protein
MRRLLFFGRQQVAIYRLLQGAVFDDHDVKAMTRAYEDALLQLKLTNRNDPVTEIVARKIVELAQSGERDPERLCLTALAAVAGVDRPVAGGAHPPQR